MPRVPHEDPPRKVSLSIPSSVMARVEVLLFNPLAGKVAYGATSELVTGLLRGWLSGQKATVNNLLNTTSPGESQKEQLNDNAA